ncbi:MLP-like protein 34 [Ziziphus jujuba]|uniref:MLP-like protein 34 n=1 Tax=Ziziphus jujuba TaxID=326968 RepID=A0ABM3ZZ41_ZIZJJ|nr:MLP-like protein 34 [Ziziphus jujuba]
MAQIIKEELEIEVKASVEKFYGLWKQKPYQIPGAASAQIQSCELREGQWGIVGSVLYWKYTHTDGKARAAEERVEEIDDENYSITFVKIGGDVMEHLKSFKVTMKFIPKGEGSMVQWISEYESKYDGIVMPAGSANSKMDEFLVGLIKNIDAYLSKA